MAWQLLLSASLAVALGAMAFVLSKWSKERALTDSSVKPRSQSWWYLTIVAAGGAVMVTIALMAMIINHFM